MKMRSIAVRVLPGLFIGTCFAATAAQAPAKPDPNQLRLTPFVLGAASSKAKPKVLPKTESQAIATKRVVRAGVIAMELPEDRMMNLVATRRADGTMQIGHEESPAASRPEVQK